VAAGIRKKQPARNFFEHELSFLTAVPETLNFTPSRNDTFHDYVFTLRYALSTALMKPAGRNKKYFRDFSQSL